MDRIIGQARRSPRHGATLARACPRPARASTANRPGSGLWHRVRTASIRTVSSGAVEKPLQASERQRGMVGPQHPQAALEHGGGRLGIGQEGDNVVLAGHFVPGIRAPCRPAARVPPAWPRTGSVSARSRPAPPAIAGEIPPADARRPTGSPRSGSMDRDRPGKPARAHGLPADPSRAGSRADRAAGQGARSFERASAISLADRRAIAAIPAAPPAA